jgi:hypothetical protein
MKQIIFPSLTAEAKYHILNYLSENKDAPHSCFEITQAVQQQNEAIRETIISGALHTLWNSGRIIKPSRGAYQMNDNFPVAGPADSNILPAPTIASALEKALALIHSYTIKVTDIDDPETFLYNRQILIETQEFTKKQIARLK